MWNPTDSTVFLVEYAYIGEFFLGMNNFTHSLLSHTHFELIVRIFTGNATKVTHHEQPYPHHNNTKIAQL